MGAGKYDQRITIKRPSGSALNAAHEKIPTYSPWITCWAAVIPLSGRDYLEAQKVKAETSYRVEVRHKEGVTPNIQIEWGSHLLHVENVLPVGRKKELHLMCVEKVI